MQAIVGARGLEFARDYFYDGHDLFGRRDSPARPEMLVDRIEQTTQRAREIRVLEFRQARDQQLLVIGSAPKLGKGKVSLIQDKDNVEWRKRQYLASSLMCLTS